MKGCETSDFYFMLMHIRLATILPSFEAKEIRDPFAYLQNPSYLFKGKYAGREQNMHDPDPTAGIVRDRRRGCFNACQTFFSILQLSPYLFLSFLDCSEGMYSRSTSPATTRSGFSL